MLHMLERNSTGERQIPRLSRILHAIRVPRIVVVWKDEREDFVSEFKRLDLNFHKLYALAGSWHGIDPLSVPSDADSFHTHPCVVK